MIMNIKFGEVVLEKNEPITVYEAANEAGLMSRAVIAAKLDGKVVALSTPIEGDAEVALLTFADEDGAHVFRHSASHVLAQAVKRLYPETKLTIGPAIDGGFYYDFDSEISFTPDILKAIEDEMKKIVKENLKIERFELPRAEAIAKMQEMGEPYKVQLIEELPDNATISFYTQGEFTDLCAGPHLFSTGAV
ncbi:MAG: threonine--tRNA ligase, partial [Clostridia bacterium]|nr:threonine--tRNA ligase [Clostridia bacterium]